MIQEILNNSENYKLKLTSMRFNIVKNKITSEYFVVYGTYEEMEHIAEILEEK